MSNDNDKEASFAGARTPHAAYIIAMNSTAVPRDEFDDWLDTEHLPERVALPGFIGAQRWEDVDRPGMAVSLYDLESLDALQTPGYKAITGNNLSPWSRRVIGRCKRDRWDAELTMHLAKPGGLGDAQALLLVAMNVAPQAEDDFDAWYTQEHVPRIFALPGVLDARRYLTVAGPQKHLAVYHLTDPDVQTSAGWKQAIDSRWGDRVRPHTTDRVRYVCRKYRRMPA